MCKENRKSRKIAVFCMWIMIGIVYLLRNGMTTFASESGFSIDAQMLPSNDFYMIQLSVKNEGKDWEGTVRTMVDESYRTSSAYDMILSLPQGSEKQFTVKIPKSSIEDTDGTVRVSVLGKKDEIIFIDEFQHLLNYGQYALNMGILSDEYSQLTFLDMGGNQVYISGREYPIKLMELSKDSLINSLENLRIMVIDTYNVSILSADELQAIYTWVLDGGTLIVGTGEYAEDTLGGLQTVINDIEYSRVYEPDSNMSFHYDNMFDFSNFHIADIRDRSGHYVNLYYTNGLATSEGDGAICVLPFSLTELSQLKDSVYLGLDHEDYLGYALEEICSNSASIWNTNSYDNDNFYQLKNLLKAIGNVNNKFDANWLCIVIVGYVIFVGPILYLILRAIKKRELYWVAVPGTMLVGVLLVFLVGRGFEIVDTRAFSVTVKELNGRGNETTFYQCYDAKIEEWSLKLNKEYEYVSSLDNSFYNYEDDMEKYACHFKKEGERLFMGVDPDSNFQNVYFMAGKQPNAGEDFGSIITENVSVDDIFASGTITNNTEYDWEMFTVIQNECMYIYEELASGETCNLSQKAPIYVTNKSWGQDISDEYHYEFFDEIYYDEESEKIGYCAALGVGLNYVYPRKATDLTVVVAVTKTWEDTIDDRCSELSYGCVYVVE